MPWIEAFRLQQQGKVAVGPEDPKERDLTPKKMSDSYHRVVLPLGQDPWLSDTYINSSGHIRYKTLSIDANPSSQLTDMDSLQARHIVHGPRCPVRDHRL